MAAYVDCEEELSEEIFFSGEDDSGDIAYTYEDISYSDYQAKEKEAIEYFDNNYCEVVKKHLSVTEESDEDFIDSLHSGSEDYIDMFNNAVEDIRSSISADKVAKKYDKVFLLLYAPLNSPMCISDDMRARTLQYENFCKVYPEMRNNPRIMVHGGNAICVTRYSDMKKKIEDFVSEMATQTKRMLIIFNGHGSKPVGQNPSNLRFFIEDDNKCSLNNVIKDVEEALVKTKKKIFGQGSEAYLDALLGQVELVFAQCFGHCFSGAPHKGGEKVEKGYHLDVIPLSEATKHGGCTRFRVSRVLLTKAISDSIHEELMKFAKEQAEADGK